MKKVLAILVLSMLFFYGCKKEEGEKPQNAKLVIITSVYPMYDFAHKIAGMHAEVTNIIPAGTEPHDWEPSPQDIAMLEKADVFIYNGAGLEHWVESVLKSVKNKKLVVIEASDGIALLKGHDEEDHDEDDDDHDGEDEHHHGEFDPHVWLNPMNAKTQIETIGSKLALIDEANATVYLENTVKYQHILDELDRDFVAGLENLPKKEFVVAHEAFGYLAERYGLIQVGIEGLSADSEPTPARMAEIIKFVKENDVRYIFFEELVNPKIAETIAKETGAKTAVLNPVESLTNEDIKEGKDYFSVMRENLGALKEALK